MTESRRTVSRATRKRATPDKASPEPKNAKATDANPYLDEETKPVARKKATTKRATSKVASEKAATAKVAAEDAAEKSSKRPRATKLVSADEPASKPATRAKTAAATEETATAPKRRGRPPKSATAEKSDSAASTTSATTRSARSETTEKTLAETSPKSRPVSRNTTPEQTQLELVPPDNGSASIERRPPVRTRNPYSSPSSSSAASSASSSSKAASSSPEESVSSSDDEVRRNGHRGGRFNNRFRGRQGRGSSQGGSQGHRNSSRNDRHDRAERHDRSADRSGDRNTDRGTDRTTDHRSSERGAERSHDRGGDRHTGGRSFSGRRNVRNHRRFDNQNRGPVAPIEPTGEAIGWFDPHRESGFIRSAENSYLASSNDPFVPAHVVRQYGLRRGDLIQASVGRDPRNRIAVVDIIAMNGSEVSEAQIRPEFQTLVASYPERKLILETGKPAKGGPELTRRAIDLIAPIGYGQRALIVAPARAGKTMLLQAVIEGIAVNHPSAHLFVLLVDERPEEVSDMISLGQGEVIASSFDMPAARHTEVAEMTLERARRLVELGEDVVIVLDSITRLARAYNTVERGTGRTLSGGLDSSAMAKPKAFFGSARAVDEENGGGSLTIIATALVETGSRMDDVIFEEFKGTGNCEIKLDRGLAEKRVFPAIDIPVSGTRREDKLFRPDQLENVYTLRRGLQQMPSSAAMEWLIKRIAGTINNDALLSGL